MKLYMDDGDGDYYRKARHHFPESGHKFLRDMKPRRLPNILDTTKHIKFKRNKVSASRRLLSENSQDQGETPMVYTNFKEGEFLLRQISELVPVFFETHV